MKHAVCICSVAFVMFSSGCGSFTASDKWNHFAFSASFSSVAVAASSEPAGSAAFTVGLGLLKEVYDGLYGSGFQIWDLAADVAGAVTGSAVAHEICMEENP